MFPLERRVTVVCGHYGTGKTNLSINLALDCARNGEDVTLVDLDVVNPYFRSADYADVLTENAPEPPRWECTPGPSPTRTRTSSTW